MKTSKVVNEMDTIQHKLVNFLIDTQWQAIMRDSKNHSEEVIERYFADLSLAGKPNYNN